jgi:hypothetical protein
VPEVPVSVVAFVAVFAAASLVAPAIRAGAWVRHAMADQWRREERIWHMAAVRVAFRDMVREGAVEDELVLADLVDATGHGVDVVLDALLPVPGPSAFGHHLFLDEPDWLR